MCISRLWISVLHEHWQISLNSTKSKLIRNCHLVKKPDTTFPIATKLNVGSSHQDLLVAALNNILTEGRYSELLAHVRRASRSQGIDEALERHKVDAIIGPADCAVHLLVCASGKAHRSNPHRISLTSIRVPVCHNAPFASKVQ